MIYDASKSGDRSRLARTGQGEQNEHDSMTEERTSEKKIQCIHASLLMIGKCTISV